MHCIAEYLKKKHFPTSGSTGRYVIRDHCGRNPFAPMEMRLQRVENDPNDVVDVSAVRWLCVLVLVHNYQHGHQPIATRMCVQLPQRKRVRNVLRKFRSIGRYSCLAGRIEQHLKDGGQHAPAHVMILIEDLLQIRQEHIENGRTSEMEWSMDGSDIGCYV